MRYKANTLMTMGLFSNIRPVLSVWGWIIKGMIFYIIVVAVVQFLDLAIWNDPITRREAIVAMAVWPFGGILLGWLIRKDKMIGKD